VPSTSQGPKKGRMSSSKGPRTKLGYDNTQSDIRVKTYCRLILLRASIMNFERLDILRDTIGHLSKNLFSFDFSQSFYSEFRASRYITGHNRTSELKVIIVTNFSELPLSIMNISIYYGIHSYIRLKSYCRFEFAQSFYSEFRES